MRPLTLLILAALLLLAARAPAAGGPHTAPTPTATSAATLSPDAGLNPRITDAAEYRFPQLLPLDGIPPICDPQFAPAAEAPCRMRSWCWASPSAAMPGPTPWPSWSSARW